MEKDDINSNNEITILKEGENLFPISNQSDRECDNLCTIENWAETMYHLKEGKSKERFIEIIKKSEYSQFFEGLNYEYGLNNIPIDIGKAFDIYKNAANNTFDTMSMYRMYHIYKKDYEKFKISERNRILEKFYLFKCFSFLRFFQIKNEQNLWNRFDILGEINIHLEYEDNDLKKFHNFINFLKKNYKIYNINQQDLIIIESIIDYLKSKNKEIKKKAINNLKDLSSDNLEALYKLTSIEENINEEETENRYKLLYTKNYYRSYIDYALYLNSKEKYKESLEILKTAKENGIIQAGYLYYEIYLNSNDFSLLMEKATTSIFKECELYKLFEFLIDDILTESIYSFFEYIFFRKICIKRYKLEKEFNQYFDYFTKEMMEFLIKMTEETSIYKKEEKVKKYFIQEEYLKELHLACGTIYYYGLENLLEIDNKKALNNFITAYKNSATNSYKRFCYYYIYQIRKRFFEQQNLNQSEGKINNLNNFINENQIKETEKILFEKYYVSINENMNYLSSSYFYYLSRLYNKKIGNNGDKLMEFICLKKATELKIKSPGTGSIIGFYRKYKAIVLMEKNKENFEKEINNNQKNIDSEGYGEDGTKCPICFENERNAICLPCKHLLCDFCIKQVNKCPICRKNIILKYFIKELEN